MHGEAKLLLLKLIKSNGNLRPLVELGFQYSQVMEEINSLVSEGLLQKTNHKIIVTDLGMREIDALNVKFKRSNSGIWIEPKLEYKIPRINKNDIFLPNQNELFYLK